MQMINKIKSYLYLMRMHRPIGSLLLLWPTLAALWLASPNQPDMKWILIFTVGVLVMRAAGCVINDLADRKFDGHVQRTTKRPLVTGEVSVFEARCLFFILMVLACILIAFTSPLVMGLSVIGALLTVVYPFLKRVTHYPQIVLGLAFAWGIPMAFAAQSGKLPFACWILFLATACWIVAFDTQYAMADREDDLKIGVKSTAIAFGHYDKLIIMGLQASMLLLLLNLGLHLHLKWFYFLSLILALGFFMYQQQLIAARNREKCLQAFLNNQWVGMLFFIGILFGR